MTQAQWFVPYLIAAGAHVVSLAMNADSIAQPTKLLLMPLLILPLVIRQSRRLARADFIVLSALLLCWAGDTFLSSAGDNGFLVGLAGFFGAHVLYFVVFRFELPHTRIPPAGALLLVWWAGMLWLLHPHLGAFFFPLAAYGIVLGLSTAAALATNRTIATGALLFLCSDTSLAFALFAPERAWWNADALIMALYAFGQLLLVVGFLREQARTRNAANVTE